MKPWGSMKLNIYGESHSEYLGLTMEVPKGILLDDAVISHDLVRRRAGAFGTTPRTEDDLPHYISGVTEGVTNGDILEVRFYNRNIRPADYASIRTIPRPSHCDYPAYMKYGAIPSGGGRFSGRLTLPLVFAGAVARQILSRNGMIVGGHYLVIGSASDTPFDPINTTPEQLNALRHMAFPAIAPAAKADMQGILSALDGDSVGGCAELCALGLPTGLGGELWGGLESRVSSLMYAIPGVKAVEFGAGTALASMRGSEANDGLRVQDNRIIFESNNSGGIQAGMANGAPLIVRVTFRPTPSIALPQHSVNLAAMENTDIAIRGRHDACIALRGLAAAEAALLIAILDAFTEEA